MSGSNPPPREKFVIQDKAQPPTVAWGGGEEVRKEAVNLLKLMFAKYMIYAL